MPGFEWIDEEENAVSSIFDNGGSCSSWFDGCEMVSIMFENLSKPFLISLMFNIARQ